MGIALAVMIKKTKEKNNIRDFGDCDQVLVFRTQTAEEGLKESLLSVITASDNATLDVLNEAFCRDAEAFSEAFQVSMLKMILMMMMTMLKR